MTASYKSFIHNTSLGMLILAPVLIALPPRKLDMYTLCLSGAFVASANQLTVERTGRGIMGNLVPQRLRIMRSEQVVREKERTKAEEFAARYQEEKARKRLLEEEVAPSSSQPRPLAALEAKVKELWMGGEQEGWRERRLREEQEKISRGEGYGSMIMDQIWEVWSRGEKKGEEIKKKGQQVVDEREQKREKMESARRREEEFPTIGKDGR